MKPVVLIFAALALSLTACGKLGRLERPEPRAGETRDIDAKPGQTLRTADPRDRNNEPLPPLVAPDSAPKAEAAPRP